MNNNNNEQYKKTIIRFLKNNNIYHKLIKYDKHNHIFNQLNSINPFNIIAYYEDWTTTKEGCAFWVNKQFKLLLLAYNKYKNNSIPMKQRIESDLISLENYAKYYLSLSTITKQIITINNIIKMNKNDDLPLLI